MSEGAEVERDILTLELGDLKETLVCTKRNGRWGRGLQNNLTKVEARMHTSLPPPCCCCLHHCMVVVVMQWWMWLRFGCCFGFV